MNLPIKTVLFDLDGTLIDTAPDLVNAVNATLQTISRPPVPLPRLRPFISLGARAMLAAALDETPLPDNFDELHYYLLNFYANHLADQSCFFPQILTVLDNLSAQHIQWGIVTNKLGWLTTPLLQTFSLTERSACIVSGDTLAEKKPHPAPLLHACQLAQTAVENCVYVGDAQRDIEAGQRAGMRTVVALYGYIASEDDPIGWGATGLIRQPIDLLHWIQQENQQPNSSQIIKSLS